MSSSDDHGTTCFPGEKTGAAPQTVVRTIEPAQFRDLFTAVMLPMFLGAVDQTLLATATPRIAADLGGLSSTSWIAVAYLLAATVMAPIYGRLGDRLGRRPALLASLLVFAVGSLACGLASSLGGLIGGRAIQGLGGGGLMVLSQALIGELVPPRLRPRYQGYFAIVFTASSVGGPVLGGFVVNHASWRWLFLVNLPLCLLAMWRVSRLPVAAPSALRDAPLDPFGVLLFICSASSLLMWLSLGGHRFAWNSIPSAGLLLFGVVAGAVLLRQQASHPAPFLPLDVLRIPGVIAICASVACFSGGLFALLFLMPIYLHYGLGADAARAGLQLLPLTVGILVGSTLNARVTSRTGRPTELPPFGMGLSALALVGLALLPPTHLLIGIASALCGLGFGTVMSSAQLATQVLAGRSRLGSAAALLSLTRSCGAAVGTAGFGGLVFALLHGSIAGPEGGFLEMQVASGAPPTPAVAHAFQIAFGSIAAFVALGAWAASRVPPVGLDAEEVATEAPP